MKGRYLSRDRILYVFQVINEAVFTHCNLTIMQMGFRTVFFTHGAVEELSFFFILVYKVRASVAEFPVFRLVFFLADQLVLHEYLNIILKSAI